MLGNLFINALAAFRLAYLLRHEDGPGDVAMKLRDHIFANYAESNHWLYRGITCFYCLSFWCGLAVVFLPTPIREGLAAAEVARRLFDKDRI
jgi:hypothetical protein